MLGGKALCRVQIISLSLSPVAPAGSRRPCRPSETHTVQTSSRGRVIRRKHAPEVDVQMNQNLARLKSFSSGHRLVTRPPSVVLNATSSLRNLALSTSLLPTETASPQQRRRRTAASWQSFMPARRIEVELLLLDGIPITTRMPWVLQFNSPVSPQHARLLLRQRHDGRF